MGRKVSTSLSPFFHMIYDFHVKLNLSLDPSAFTYQRASSTELKQSFNTLCLICCFKGQLKGEERKWRIGRLLFRLLQHLQQLRQAWTRNPRSNPLTRSRITVSQWTQHELLFVRLYIFSTDLQTSWFWSELLHAAELHLCCITAVWGAKLASGNTKPLVDLSQHVTGDVLRTSRS